MDKSKQQQADQKGERPVPDPEKLFQKIFANSGLGRPWTPVGLAGTFSPAFWWRGSLPTGRGRRVAATGCPQLVQRQASTWPQIDHSLLSSAAFCTCGVLG
jgi:hypothetical protein